MIPLEQTSIVMPRVGVTALRGTGLRNAGGPGGRFGFA